MEAVSFSNEVIYQYQISRRNTTDVLEVDRERLRLLQQPALLNQQLIELYAELTNVENGESNTSSSNAIEINGTRRELRRPSVELRRAMLYEENAPLPQLETIYSTEGW